MNRQHTAIHVKQLTRLRFNNNMHGKRISNIGRTSYHSYGGNVLLKKPMIASVETHTMGKSLFEY